MARRIVRSLVGSCVAITLCVPVFTSTAAPVRASGSGSCQTADMAVAVNAAQGAAAGHEVYTATIENFGPCNSTNLVFTDTLPNSTQVTFTKLNPGSWDCGQTTSTNVHCTLGELSGASATPENPSTAVIAYDVSLPVASGRKQTIVAETNAVAVSADQVDPDLTNNHLWAGLLQSSTATQSFVQGSETGSNPSAAVPETIRVDLPPGSYAPALAQLFNNPVSVCSSVVSSFCATIDTENGSLQTITLERLASLANATDVYHELDSSATFQKLAACPKGHKVPTVGCIAGITTASDAAGTYDVITISTPTNGHWA